ncbi:MAG: universal stress protein [Chloroflexota bacterium]|nr:universal stress protein [Chloroflexota bacterium]
MSDTAGHKLFMAKEDFRRARRRAALEAVLARLMGRSAELLSYEDVKRRLKPIGSTEKGYQEIPLDKIVGSVGRYQDFTRSFLPRDKSSEHRWARVKVAMTKYGFDPIEVYQVGDAYFVKDGNHRVSIARRMGNDTIPAYVTEIRTKVPFSSLMEPDDLIRQTEYADFLEHSQLDKSRPDADLTVSLPGRYSILEQQIDAYQHVLEETHGEPVDFPEAAAAWYDNIYLPVVHVIRQEGILRDFPDRTETDLYLWIVKHREELTEALGWEIAPEDAASNLAEKESTQSERLLARVSGKIKEALTPGPLELGPETGDWRRVRVDRRQDDFLFNDIMVAHNGEAAGWQALEQALVVAKREEGRVIGLHVVPSDEQVESDEVAQMRARFRRHCEEAGIPGYFVVKEGEVASTVAYLAGWTDLLVATLSHPPAPQPLARLTSGFRSLVRRCPRPMLVLPDDAVSELNSALLAYDGSAKAEEALYVATYLAAQWSIPLVVVTVLAEDTTAETLERARAYLTKHGVEAAFEEHEGPVAETILQRAKHHDSALILMGGYSFSVPYQAVLGSVVDQVLREARRPLLLCR